MHLATVAHALKPAPAVQNEVGLGRHAKSGIRTPHAGCVCSPISRSFASQGGSAVGIPAGQQTKPMGQSAPVKLTPCRLSHRPLQPEASGFVMIDSSQQAKATPLNLELAHGRGTQLHPAMPQSAVAKIMHMLIRSGV